jgi:predicted ABC-class ATPase
VNVRKTFRLQKELKDAKRTLSAYKNDIAFAHRERDAAMREAETYRRRVNTLMCIQPQPAAGPPDVYRVEFTFSAKEVTGMLGAGRRVLVQQWADEVLHSLNEMTVKA